MKGFIKFVIIGGCSTGIDFLIYFLCSQKIDITISKFFSMLVACIFSFFFNKKWTFEVEEKTNWKHLIKYLFSQGVNIGVNVGTNTLVFELTNMKLIAYVMATGLGMIVNFMLQKFMVFRKTTQSKNN